MHEEITVRTVMSQRESCGYRWRRYTSNHDDNCCFIYGLSGNAEKLVCSDDV